MNAEQKRAVVAFLCDLYDQIEVFEQTQKDDKSLRMLMGTLKNRLIACTVVARQFGTSGEAPGERHGKDDGA